MTASSTKTTTPNAGTSRADAADPLGPDSLTWKYFGDLRTGMLGVWIGAMQNMYPELGAGVEDHSILLREPLQRVARSVYPIMGVVYDGDRASATGAQIRNYHQTIKGTDAEGRRYHALNPETFYWAHATFFMLIVKTAEYFCGGLTEAEKRQLFDEHVQWYRMYGMSMRPVPETWEDFGEYWDAKCRDELEINRATLDIFSLRIPKPWFVAMPTPVWDQLFRPLVAGQRWIAAGLFDPALREKAGMRWTPGDEVLLRLFGKFVEVAFTVVPDDIRLHPRALAAYRRASGRIPSDAPLVEAPAFTGPPRDRRDLPMHYVPRGQKHPSLIERAGSLVHTTFSLAGLRPRAVRRDHERLPDYMLEWSDVDIAVRDAVREFIDKEIRPHLDELEDGDMPPYPIIRKLFTTFGIDAMAKESLEKRLAKMRDGGTPSGRGSSGGMFGGGSDQAGMGFVVVSELCRVSMGVVTGMGVSLGLTVPTIQSRGTLAQQERWLPGLVTYEKIGAWAITEPDSGSDAFGGMKSYVVRDGDDYILNGQKTFITNGPDADVTVVYAKLDEGDPAVSKRDRKVLTFVLDKGMDGFVQSKPFRKMGIHSSRTGELFFNDVRLGRDRLLGETEDNKAGDGRDSARSSFSTERIGVAAMALGVIEECLRLCVDYAKTRTLWEQQIGQFQLIQLKLASMEVARMNVRNMLFRVIEASQKGAPISLAEASAMKWYCSQAATDVAMEAIQIFGGNGYMTEYRVEQLARDAKSLMIYAGSNEVQITHVARGLLSD